MATTMLWLTSCAPGLQPVPEVVAPSAPATRAPAVTPPQQAAAPKRPRAPVAARETSQCISPKTVDSLELSVAYEVASLNADTNTDIAVLEYLISQVDPAFTCGTLLMEQFDGNVRSVRAYRLTSGASKFNNLVGPIQSAMQQTRPRPLSSVVVVTDFPGLLPQILKRRGWGAGEVSGPLNVLVSERELYRSLATSNQTTYVSSIRSVGSTSTVRDVYNCADFASQAAAQDFFRGLPDDVNGLDGDNDGLACESLDNMSGRYRVLLADVPTRAPVAVSSPAPLPSYSAPSTNSGRCYVRGYTRSNGTRVSGYYRRC